MIKEISVIRKLLSCLIVCLLSTLTIQAQTGNTITGKVTDKKGEDIIGASVLIKGTSLGTITDINGNFTLSNVSNSATLSISFIGYQTQEVRVGSQRNLIIKLEDDTQILEEVVVVGYGVQRKSDLTGAVASVKADDILANTPTTNIESALQGRLAGVSIISGSGDPSAAATIRVRGANSIMADGGPLVVVDGFIGGSLNMINPGDVESIEVLKDASATAVYGSRGANGVILITTKAPTTGKVNVEYNGHVNFKTSYSLPDMLSAGQMAELANAYGQEFYESAGQATREFYTPEEAAAFYKDGGYDYIGNIFRDPAIEHTHELSLSGGSEKTKFIFSGRYNLNQGIAKESQRELVNYRLKVDTEVLKWLKAGFNFTGNYSKSQGPNFSGWRSVLSEAMNFPNTIQPKDEEGNYNNKNILGGNTYNPMGQIWEVDRDGFNYGSTLQGYLEVDILKGLSFRMNQSFYFGSSSNLNTESVASLSGWNNGNKSRATAYVSQAFNWTNQNILSYVREFNDKHRINATAVIEQSSNNNFRADTEGKDLISTNVGANNTGLAANVYASSGRTINTMLSYLGRVNYVFMNRYMLTASWRYDGSSNLAKGNKWEQFPSVALAWNVKEEPFLRDVEFLSQLKLRGGYGETGHQAIAAYSDKTKLGYKRNPDGSLVILTEELGASNLRWERTIQWNGGIDLGFFNNRLTFALDIYDKLTKDALLKVVAPSHTAFPNRLMNAAEISNKGFEITIGSDPVVTRDFSWNTNITLSRNKSVIENLHADVEYAVISGGYQNDYFRNIKGEKLGTMWGYVSDGVWKSWEIEQGLAPAGTQAGSYKFKNLDGDEEGKITTEDQTIIGNGQPSFQWGWSNTLMYKGFDLGFSVIGVHGFDIYNYTREARFGSGQNPIVLGPNPEWLNRWTKDNENTDIAGFITARNARTPSSQYVEKGDFIKVKSITLGYTLPSALLRKAGISNVRIYGSIQNPFLITDYSGIDPEVTLKSPLTSGIDYGYYPNGRNYLFGLKFAF